MNFDPRLNSNHGTEFVKLTGDTKASLALLVENGMCKVNASASMVILPSMSEKSYEGDTDVRTSTSTSSSASSNKFEALPASARDVYFGDKNRVQPPSNNNKAGSAGTVHHDEFLDDNWYFVELHQTILQESTQRSS